MSGHRGIENFKIQLYFCQQETFTLQASVTTMAIDLYYVPGSAPCRFVLLIAAALDIKLNLNLMDLRAGDQLKPEFLKVNAMIKYLAVFLGDLTFYSSNATNLSN